MKESIHLTIVTHESIPCLFNKDSKILILGSFPSQKSREKAFYYMHERNRFWTILSECFKEEIKDKKTFCYEKHIALWDVIFSCEIKNSSDSSIKNVIPNDILTIIKHSKIQAIFTNGKTAHKLYQKYLKKITGIEDICLPSTSPANCRINFEDLLKSWLEIRTYLSIEKKKEI